MIASEMTRWKEWEESQIHEKHEKQRANEVDDGDVEENGEDKEMRLTHVKQLFYDMNEEDNIDIDTIGESRIS